MTDDKLRELAGQDAHAAVREVEKECTIDQKCPFDFNCHSEDFHCTYWKPLPSREQSIADILKQGPVDLVDLARRLVLGVEK